MRWKLGLILGLLAGLIAACNLTTEAIQPTAPPIPTFTPIPTRTPVGGVVTPTPVFALPPLPEVGTPLGAAVTADGFCQVYLTYSGSNPENKLSLRAEPRTSARQLIRLPNKTRVLLVPGSAEVAADDYNWLNIIYIDENQQRYEGWAAKDAYEYNGVRDRSLATLRQTSERAPC
ncbi:MAG TPA: hypothetical protein VHO69_13905 [Phototrophicaceae bacterium]|nr:hypothetical protein [Phototrophicaceae bacterium]